MLKNSSRKTHTIFSRGLYLCDALERPYKIFYTKMQKEKKGNFIFFPSEAEGKTHKDTRENIVRNFSLYQ